MMVSRRGGVLMGKSTDSDSWKRCGVCGKNKDKRDEFYSYKNHYGSLIWRSYCKKCDNHVIRKRNRRDRWANP